VAEKQVEQAEINRQIRTKNLFQDAWKQQIPKQFSPTATKSRLSHRTVLPASINPKWVSEPSPEIQDDPIEYPPPRTCTLMVISLMNGSHLRNQDTQLLRSKLSMDIPRQRQSHPTIPPPNQNIPC